MHRSARVLSRHGHRSGDYYTRGLASPSAAPTSYLAPQRHGPTWAPTGRGSLWRVGVGTGGNTPGAQEFPGSKGRSSKCAFSSYVLPLKAAVVALH